MWSVVDQNVVMRRMTVYLTCEEGTGGTRDLNKEEFHDLYSSNILWVIQQRRMRSVGHALCMAEKRNAYSFWWGNLNKRDYSEAEF